LSQINCKVCGSSDTKHLIDLNDFFNDQHSYPLYRCNSCESLFYDPFPLVNYADTYQDILKKYYVEYDAGLLFMTSLLQPVLGKKKISSILEIGAGYGFLLDIARQIFEPKSIVGVEPSDNSHQMKELFDIDFLQDFFNEKTCENFELQDLIIASEVIEHTFDPEQFLLDIKNRLKDDGIGILTTPNASELFYNASQNGYESDQYLFPGAHTIIFSKQSLESLMKKHDLFFKVFLSEGEREKTSLIVYFSKSEDAIKCLEYAKPTNERVKLLYKKYLVEKIKKISNQNMIYLGYLYRLIEIKINTGDFKGIDSLFKLLMEDLQKNYYVSLIDYQTIDYLLSTSTFNDYIDRCPSYTSRLAYYYGVYMEYKGNNFKSYQAYTLAQKLFEFERNFSLFNANQSLKPISEEKRRSTFKKALLASERTQKIKSNIVFKVFKKLSLFFLKKLVFLYGYLNRQRIRLKVHFDMGDLNVGELLLSENFAAVKSNSVAVFSHYDRDNVIDDYVLEYINALVEQNINVVFVSTSEKLNDDELSKVRNLCTKIIVKENKGYDFGSWKTGITVLGKELDNYERLILCNDSVYAPLFPLNCMFEKMNGFNCWSITDNNDFSHHMQSYFMSFSKEIFQKDYFIKFWKNIRNHKFKQSIILNYEVGLTILLEENGVKPKSYCSQSSYSKKNVNITHTLWKELIIDGQCPILKIELLRDNPLNLDLLMLKDILNKNTSFDVKLIDNHQKRMKLLKR
jgi:rhamnosyltransferase